MSRGIAGVWVLALAGCASGTPKPSSAQAVQVVEARPGQLDRYAGSKVMVFPVQTLPIVEPSSWRSALGDVNTLLVRSDTTIETAIAGRGLGGLWIFPAALQRSARRNPTYLSDPYVVRVAPAIHASVRKRDTPIPEPAASQIRALAGVNDARYALVPLELRFSATGTESSAILRLAIVDARLSQVVWMGEIRTAPRAEFGFEMIEDLAQRLADLVAPR
jgi:hypothetical protein